MTTPPAPTLPVFKPGYMPSDADLNTWWYDNAWFLSTRVVFRARQISTAQSIPYGAQDTPIQFDTIDEDPYGGWNPANYRWQAPVSGWYQVNVLAFLSGLVSGASVTPQILTGAYIYNVAQNLPSTGHNGGARGTFAVYMTGGSDSVAGAVTVTNTGVTTSILSGQRSAMEITWLSD
jgi:hypothetical protein